MILATSRIAALLLAMAALGGCTQAAVLGSAAAEQRRTMNDLQARATMAAACDISIGAYFRELNDAERRYVAEICG